MSKIQKIVLILFLLLCLFINVSFAENTTNSLDSNVAGDTASGSSYSSSAESKTDSENSMLDTTSTTQNTTSSATTTVSTINPEEESKATFQNILNILLITIGVIIILFAIAILIRLR